MFLGGGERLEGVIEVLTEVSKREPELSKDDTEATWKVDREPGTVRLTRIDRRWYLRNR